MSFNLLSPAITNAKTSKNEGRGYHSAILHLAPSVLSGYNVCPNASEGCKKACLNTAGRGAFSNVQNARIRKTKLYFEDRKEFMRQLYEDLKLLIKQAEKKNLIPVCRLNGTSDLPWFNVISDFPMIQFYDYTKSIKRVEQLFAAHKLGKLTNYHLTFSRSESNWNECLQALNLGFNVAIVFGSYLRDSIFIDSLHKAFTVVDGLLHDLRFLDPKGSIVGLIEKGRAKQDETGFVFR